MSETRTGRCLCGTVSFATSGVPDRFGACHCEMCRRWTGSALLGITVPKDKVAWKGAEHVATIQSSDWAERAFCARCGSGLYYHVTAEGPMTDSIEMPIGIFDDASGLTFSNEIYIDHKPDSYAFAGDRTRLTRKETLARFGIVDEGAGA